MASRNLKPSSVQGFDSTNMNDKMQSSTLKRQPSPDWSKSDLLRLLSYFEGELQARDITIATLKAEKAKQLLYQAKYGRFGLGDPFVALQRDAEGKNDTGFDESAIKSMYDNQLAQLENLIATQRKAQLKMREQLGNSEKRFHKVCTELEEEKQKHAQDTAQGDDVTYMLEKERERLKAEIDFEKSQSKKLEKDLKKTLASLEEERANSARHKQVAIMLIKERKNLIERIVAENQLRDEMESALTDGKSKMQNMAEGLAQESKKSLKMEAALEKQNTKFDAERDTLRLRLQEEERQTNAFRAEVGRLSKQLESLQQQVRSSGGSPSSIQIRSSASPGRSTVSPSPVRTSNVPPVEGSTPQSCLVDSPSLEHASTVVDTPISSPSLEFLGPEMANLQQLLAAMTTGEASSSNPLVTSSPTTPVSLFPSSSSPSSTFSSPQMTSYQNKSTSSSSASFSDKNNQPTIASSKEQNNNMIKMTTSSQEIKSSATVTAQIFTPASRAQNIPHHIYNEQITYTPSTYMTHHMTAPTSVTPSAFLTLNPSISSPSPKLSLSPSNPSNTSASSRVIISQPLPSKSPSPTSKRKSIPPRARSKSPSKTSHHHPRSFSSSRLSSSSSPLSPASPHNPDSTTWSLSPSPSLSLRLSPATEVQNSPIHRLTACGDLEALHVILKEGHSDANVILRDGTTPLHCAAENNQEACMKLLLENGGKPSSLRDDRVTPLHMAALRGYTGCLRLLLTKGAAVNLATLSNQTPLHLAVKAGHLECCQLLLRHGANVLYAGQEGLTAIHYAVQNNHPEMLKTLLDRLKLGGTTRDSDTAHQLVAVTDSDGWSISHMAAHLPKPDCLVMLAENLPLDFDAKDKLGRSVKAIASVACRELLADIDRPSNPMVKVVVELRYMLENTAVSSVNLGVMEVGPGIGWRTMEERLRATLNAYIAQLDQGLRTRRITRLDSDLDRLDRDFTLGLTMSNIKQFEMGFYKWTPGMQTDTSPYLILCNNENKKITITVDDASNMCELIAFDVLHPVSSINNYLRLLEQSKSVIFYGPAGSGKSYLAHRLAQSIAAQEMSNGRKPAIYQLSLQPGYTFASFLAFLKHRNCAVPIHRGNENLAPILLLDNLETVNIADLFGELLDPMEYRGIGHAFCLRGDSQGENGMHYLTDQFYVIGTMNKSRSLGVDLSILPRFRWVQFRLDTEPLRGLLARHFLRRIFNTNYGRLPSPDDPVLRAVEWVVCVWQRLNDSLNKLGLPEVVLGPCMFFKCPLEKQDQKLILDWMKNTWNQLIAPRVREAVKRGTGSEAPSDGQQKVANTALYVLMQRSVILSCPLSGKEKDSYLAGFSGSNELDIPLKPGDNRVRSSPLPTMNSNQQRNSQQQQQHPPQRPSSLSGTQASPVATAMRSKARNGREERRSDSALGASNIKRRSLSESSVNKAAQLEQQQQQQQLLDSTQAQSSQAKMAKLEVKSPKIVSISSAFRSPSFASPQPTAASDSPELGQAAKKTGRVSPLLSLVSSNRNNSPHIGQKKSRSSENISGSGLFAGSGKLRSPGPFSFSLATPTSNLNSFKFLEKSTSEGAFADQMPDFSVFNKVPTPTDELPPSRSFVFVGKPDNKVRTQSEQSPGEGEEVWSKRTDVFVPIQKPRERSIGGGNQRRDGARNKSDAS